VLAGAFIIPRVVARRAMTPFSFGARPGTVLFKALIPDDHSE
jgi:hypothetical protein